MKQSFLILFMVGCAHSPASVSTPRRAAAAVVFPRALPHGCGYAVHIIDAGSAERELTSSEHRIECPPSFVHEGKTYVLFDEDVSRHILRYRVSR